MGNLSLIFSKSIMQNKIWVFVYRTWELEFYARRRKHTSHTYYALAFWSWLCRTIQGIWNHQKIKKIRMRKKIFFSFFVLFLHQMRETCSGKIEIPMLRCDVTWNAKALSLKCLKKKKNLRDISWQIGRQSTQENFMSRIA